MLPYRLHLLEGSCDQCHRIYVKRSLKPMKTGQEDCWKCPGIVKLFKLKHWTRYVNVMENGATLIEGNQI